MNKCQVVPLLAVTAALICGCTPGQRLGHNNRVITSGAVGAASAQPVSSPTQAVEVNRPTTETLATHSPVQDAGEPANPLPAESGMLTETPETAESVFRRVGGTLRLDGGQVVEMDLSFSSVTDRQIQLLRLFPGLRELDLTGTDVHDRSMATIASLPDLQSLKLKGTGISSEGLETLSQATSLILLDVSNTNIGDDGLTNADRWENLRYLSLNDTAVTDSGVSNLQSLATLKGLSLINTAVTAAGVQKLMKALPECLIVAQTDTEASTRRRGQRPADPGPLNSATAGVASNQQLEQVVELAAQQPHLAVHLSAIYSDRGQWLEAARVLASGAVADVNNQAIHFKLGEALARTGQTEAAYSHFSLAVGEAAASYNVGLIEYERTLIALERRFSEALQEDPSLDQAQHRLNEVREKLAQIRLDTQGNRQDPPPDDLQVVPAAPVRHASQTRVRRID